MATYKEINLHFDGFTFNAEANNESDTVTLRLNNYVLDKKKSAPLRPVYKVGKKLEVYAAPDEIKEMIESLKQVLVIVEEDFETKK